MTRKAKQLLKDLESPSAKERYLAIIALGRLGDTRTLPAIDKVATLDKNTKVRNAAYQAVRYLSELKKQQDQEAHRARLDAEDDDGEVGWGDIDNFLADDDDDEDDDDSGSWSYTDAQQKHQAAKKAEQAAEKRERRRSRRRYRIILWLAVAVAVMGLAIVAADLLEKRELPKSRTEALERLGEWLADMSATREAYNGVMLGLPVDCAAFQAGGDYAIPGRPSWAGPDKDHQDNLDEFFTAMQQIETDLNVVKQAIQQFCSNGEESILLTQEQISRLKPFIDGTADDFTLAQMDLGGG